MLVFSWRNGLAKGGYLFMAGRSPRGDRSTRRKKQMLGQNCGRLAQLLARSSTSAEAYEKFHENNQEREPVASLDT